MGRLSWRTAGESHGLGLLAILEGFPAGFALDLARLDADLARRQVGYGRGGRMKIERDHAQIQAGLRAGRTLGSPIAIWIENRDQTLERLPVPTNPRPGHADLAGCQKLGVRDPRAVLERASARETAARVALGAIAAQLLEAFGVEVFAHVVELAGQPARADSWDAAGADRRDRRLHSDFACLDPDVEPLWRARVDAARDAGDSLGGVFEVRAEGLIPGLGSYHSGPERLSSRLGAALFSIPAIKGVEIGLGFEAARLPGSAFHDAIELDANAATVQARSKGPAGADAGRGDDAGRDDAGRDDAGRDDAGRDDAGREGARDTSARFGRFRRATNRAGGLEGGMTTGEPLILRAAMKPIPTLRRGVATVDFASGDAVQATYQRSDVTSVPAASVVGEAVIALELAAALLERFGGDSIEQVRAAFEDQRARVNRI